MMNPILKPLLFLSLLLVTSNSSAFTLITNTLTSGWDETTLTFNVNETSCTALGIDADTLNSAIDAAVEVWNKAPTPKLKLARGSVVTSTSSTNPPTIYCSNLGQSDGTAGVGGVSTSGGVPAAGSLYLNGDSSKTAYFKNLTTAQQQIVLAHEMGHVLGLGHSEREYALMYYNISSKENLNLSQDDIDGLTWLNPRDELKSGIMGCATIDSNGGHPPAGGNSGLWFNWALLLMLAVLISQRKSGSFS